MMNRMTPNSWKPSHTMLAAYADGEFEGRDDLAALKTKIEEFLSDHPQSAMELAEYRRLRNLWHDTPPPNPSKTEWDVVSRCVRHGVALVQRKKSNARRWWLTVASTAAGIALLVTALVWVALHGADSIQVSERNLKNHTQANIESDNEPFSVASMEEVEILSVDGDDVSTLIVGALPVDGLVEPADAGDVTEFLIPDNENNIMVVSDPGERPMVIALID